MNSYDLEKDLQGKREARKSSGLVMEILLAIFIIVNIIQKKECYDLIVILLSGILVENIVQYKQNRHKEDFIAAIAISFAIVFVIILRILV